ncbi:MAG: cytochrome bc1 complex cytochrome b subunit [Acidimicrobiales bacterium]
MSSPEATTRTRRNADSGRPRTKREAKQALGPYGRVGKAINELDDRLGVARGGRVFLDKIFPDHWSFMLGEIALYSFVVLLATGVFLSFYFVPSTAQVIYHGVYKPLDGQKVSAAYASTVNISFSVRAGLLMRQMHHWAADIFVGSIVVHMARVFFTGAFRKPRETNWLIGSTLLILAILNGFIGYSLPDDLISGTGLRIGYSIILSIPFVGSYLASFLFGGNFPGNIIIPRFFILHVLILPAIIVLLLGAHLGLLVRQKHTQFPGKGRSEHNVVGSPMFPTFMAKTTGFLFMVAGGIALLGGFAQINPIWQFGPYQPDKISYAVQPDWYMGWLDGALRIMPSWEFTGFGHTWPLEVFIPAILFPGVVFGIAQMWPMIERKITNDDEMHNLLDRPRFRPKRTAFGAAFFAMLFVLFGASSTDVLANFFQISLNEVLWFFRIAVFVIPVIVGVFTWRICIEMQGVPTVGKRKRAVTISMTQDGGYVSETSDPRPGDGHVELDPTPVPVKIDIDLETVGAGGRGGRGGGGRGGGDDTTEEIGDGVREVAR